MKAGEKQNNRSSASIGSEMANGEAAKWRNNGEIVA
jgi:hypothetical protein